MKKREGVRIVIFYTINTPYKNEADRLIESLKAYNYRYQLYAMPSKGCWVLNCGMKPRVIQQALQDFPDEDILYLDADATVEGSLKGLLEEVDGYDLGVHYRNNHELLSGTIFLRNNWKIRKLVRLWIIAQDIYANTWDQKVLAQVLEEEKGIKVAALSPEYCKIFDKEMGCTGKPIIVHHQASRRLKPMVSSNDIPDRVFNMRIRRSPDGTFWIPRNSKEVEQYLDKNYVRVKGELRWYPMSKGDDPLDGERETFEGKGCYIIGKGPSLDNLSESDFLNTDWPVICINEAIHKVEELDIENPVYTIQQDTGLKGTCQPKKPSSKLLISYHARHHYSDSDNKIIYSPDDLGLSSSTLTVLCAIKIAQRLDTKQITMLCFDACVNKKTAYAKCVGYSETKGGSADRFLKHRQRIDDVLGDTRSMWLIPSAPSSTSSYTPQHTLDYPEEHHGLGDMEPLEGLPTT